MFPLTSAMKLITFLSASAALGLGVSLLDLSFNAQALGSYAAAASVLILLVAAHDYRPRRAYWQPARSGLAHFPTRPARQMERLAA